MMIDVNPKLLKLICFQVLVRIFKIWFSLGVGLGNKLYQIDEFENLLTTYSKLDLKDKSRALSFYQGIKFVLCQYFEFTSLSNLKLQKLYQNIYLVKSS